jgi:hypothetical protein
VELGKLLAMVDTIIICIYLRISALSLFRDLRSGCLAVTAQTQVSSATEIPKCETLRQNRRAGCTLLIPCVTHIANVLAGRGRPPVYDAPIVLHIGTAAVHLKAVSLAMVAQRELGVGVSRQLPSEL